MSALAYLCDYESNSEDSDCDLSNKRLNRPKFPVPNLSKVPVVPLEDVHEDNSLLHGGRIRSFPHVRGNWATFVYLHYNVHGICALINKLEEIVIANVGSCNHCEDFHISLSKTFVLKYHLISPFSTSLQKSLSNIDSFDLVFAAVKIYCNEENSRTFISLEVDPFTQKSLLGISKKIDGVLSEFQLPTFYENASFHMSVLWVNGNQKSELKSVLEDLNDVFIDNIKKSPKTFVVDTINCRSGNKYFQYSLC